MNIIGGHETAQRVKIKMPKPCSFLGMRMESNGIVLKEMLRNEIMSNKH